MSSRILTPKQECRADCPKGNHAWTERGEVVRCEHGAYFFALRSIPWAWRFDRGAWERLSRFWTPIRYRRAVKALADGDADAD